jgi:hypothetical protein
MQLITPKSQIKGKSNPLPQHAIHLPPNTIYSHCDSPRRHCRFHTCFNIRSSPRRPRRANAHFISRIPITLVWTSTGCPAVTIPTLSSVLARKAVRTIWQRSKNVHLDLSVFLRERMGRATKLVSAYLRTIVGTVLEGNMTVR